MTLNTSLLGVTYYARTSTPPMYQSAQEIWSA